jgi:hypothetical protein
MEEEGRGEKRKKSRGRKLVMKNEMDSNNYVVVRSEQLDTCN